jgi:hypothetical protein
MSGIFGTKASPQADVNLILQIAIIIILIAGRRLAKNRKLLTHGRLMAALVILHSVAIVLIMVPSFLINFSALKYVSDPKVIITWIHAVVGTSAEALGVYLVYKWRFKPQSVGACATRRKYMIPAFEMWGLSASLGIVFYALYYL